MNNSLNEVAQYCPHCGRPITANDTFCASCGKVLSKINTGDIKSFQSFSDDPKTKKLYSEAHIIIGAFIGGPLVTSIFLSKNFKVLGKENASTISLVIGIVITIALLLFALLIPESIDENIPKYLLPMVFTGITILIFYSFQRKAVEDILFRGAQKESGWKVFGFTSLGIAISVGLLLFLIVAQDSSFSETVVFREDGIEEFNKGLSYQETNQMALAEQQYKLAIKKNPNLAEAYLNLGLIYMEDEWFEGAEKMTLKSIELLKHAQMSTAEGSYVEESLSMVYNNLGIIEINKAIEADTGYNYYSAKDHWKKAMEYFYEAIDLDPTNSKAQGNIKRFSDLY